MKRRGFLKASAAGCALALVEPVSSFSETKESTITPPAFELEEMSVSELQQGMQSGKYSSRSLVEKYVDRIFLVFQRLHTRQNYEGTGMGLAITRKIAEHHGGCITAHSKPNEGSTFVVLLPLKQKSPTI